MEKGKSITSLEVVNSQPSTWLGLRVAVGQGEERMVYVVHSEISCFYFTKGQSSPAWIFLSFLHLLICSYLTV